jgi:hypothetical protein
MVLELLQMTLAVGLFAVGLVLLAMIHLAQRGSTLRLAPPVWVQWAAGLLVFVLVVAACQPLAANLAPTSGAQDAVITAAATF